MITFRAWTKEPLPPRTEEEKAQAYEALRRAQELREEMDRRGYRWRPISEELDEWRQEREDEIG